MHAGQADHRADRQIDAAGQDDERHADRDDADDHRLVEQIEQIVGLEEIGREQRQRDRDDERERRASAVSSGAERRLEAPRRGRALRLDAGDDGARSASRHPGSYASRESVLELRRASPPPAGRDCRRRITTPIEPSSWPRWLLHVDQQACAGRCRDRARNPPSAPASAARIGVSSKRGAAPALQARDRLRVRGRRVEAEHALAVEHRPERGAAAVRWRAPAAGRGCAPSNCAGRREQRQLLLVQHGARHVGDRRRRR